MQHKFIRLPAVRAITGLPKSTIYRKISEKAFPPQIAIGPKTVVWLESDIQKWMEEKIAQLANNNERWMYEQSEAKH